jgi:carbamoyl-phosphate synthase large subunit
MRSTGEVLGLAASFGLAYFKSQEAATPPLPVSGTVFISVTDRDKPALVEVARKFQELGFKLTATQGTQDFLQSHGVKCDRSFKLHEFKRPHIVDEIMSRAIALVINTPIGKAGKFDDSYIRKAAIKYKVPYVTTIAAARAAVVGIAESRTDRAAVKSLQEYHAEIR